MPLFKSHKSPKFSRRIDPRIRKQMESKLKDYAKHDEVEHFFNERVTDERRKQLWASMSPRLRMKVLEYIKNRGEHGKKQ